MPVILVIDKKRQITCPALYPRDQIVCGAFRFLLPHDHTSAEVGIFFWPTFLPFFFVLIFEVPTNADFFFANFLKCSIKFNKFRVAWIVKKRRFIQKSKKG